MRPCGNAKCKKGEGGQRAMIHDASQRNYCSPECGDSVRCRRYYKRKKDKVEVIPCSYCQGTGRVTREVS